MLTHAWQLVSCKQCVAVRLRYPCALHVKMFFCFVFSTYLMCVCVCACVRAYVHVCMCFPLSFHHVDLRDQTEVVRFGNKCLHPLSHLPTSY